MIQTLFSFVAYEERNMNSVNGLNTSGDYYIGIQKTEDHLQGLYNMVECVGYAQMK